MLDINFIKDNIDKVKKGVAAKGYDSSLIDKALELYDNWTERLQIYEGLSRQRNILSKRGKLSEEAKAVKEKRRKAELDVYEAWKAYDEVAKQIPNLPLTDVPIGKGESANLEIKRKKPSEFNFKIKDYETLGETLGIVDTKRAAKVSGSRFGYLVDKGVRLEFALLQYAMEILIKEGFIPIIPPALIKPTVKRELGYMEHGAHENWYLVGEPEKEVGEPNFYLIGTAEHSIVPFYKDEVLEEKDLPRRFVGFSTSFRREAGTYGRDTKGIFRVHQFDKVEMVSFTTPEKSIDEHEFLLSLQEKLVRGLNLPYRIVKVCSGDMAFPTARQYDLEIWFPSEGRYRETHSTSNTTDFQARRLKIRYESKTKVKIKPEKSKVEITESVYPSTKPFVHILNGTVFAIGRTIIAILENFQTEDGSVKIPEVLHKYTGFSEINPK